MAYLKERDYALDFIRSIAIICVVLTHSTETAYSGIDVSIATGLSKLHLFCAITLHTIGRLGVPLFFFLTGYLLLDRNYESKEKRLHFYKSNLLPLIITSEIWGVIYYAYCVLFLHMPFSFDKLLKEVLMIDKFEGAQFWYIPQIVGIYLFLPAISIALKHLDEKYLYSVSCIVFCYLFVPPVINAVHAVTNGEMINPALNFSFAGGIYGFLVILGYFSKREMFQKIRIWQLFILFALAMSIQLGIECWSYQHDVKFLAWYDDAPLIIASFSLFEAFRRMKNLPFKKGSLWLSKSAFGIYLIHYLFNMYFHAYVHIDHFWLANIILFMMSFGMSVLFVTILSINKKMAQSQNLLI